MSWPAGRDSCGCKNIVRPYRLYFEESNPTAMQTFLLRKRFCYTWLHGFTCHWIKINSAGCNAIQSNHVTFFSNAVVWRNIVRNSVITLHLRSCYLTSPFSFLTRNIPRNIPLTWFVTSRGIPWERERWPPRSYATHQIVDEIE